MGRAVEFDVAVDTSTFAALQLQPRVAAGLTWNALARWLRAHLVSFPLLIRRESTGLVVMGFTLEFRERVSFFDCETVHVQATVRAAAGGARLLVATRVQSPAGRPIATTRLVLCPVAIEDEVSLAAAPAPLPPRLLERFRPDEVDAGVPPRVVPERRAFYETSGAALAEGAHDFMVHRHRCEVAEQWSWTEVPALIEEARERLAFGQKPGPVRKRCLGQPLQRMDIEFGKPFFALDRGVVRSRVFAAGDRLGLVHRLTSADGTALHATAVEVF